MMPVPNPIAEWDRLQKSGREGFVQYMLAGLVLGDRPRGWNKPGSVSAAGSKLIRLLDEHAFGASRPDDPEFFWEYKLPARPIDPENGWPDLAAIWQDRALLIELKTEAGSIREGQLDWYLELADARFGRSEPIDLLYITRDPIAEPPPNLTERMRYANMVWTQVAQLIEQAWASQAVDHDQRAALLFADYLRELPGTKPKTRRSAAPKNVGVEAAVDGNSPAETGTPDVEAARAVALAVEGDGRQRAYAFAWESEKQVTEFRRLLLSELAAPSDPDQPILVHAKPWIWRPTTGGPALTDIGGRGGFELRFSFTK